MAVQINVDELLLGLASLGFELEDCQLAVEAGNNTLESAVEWLITKQSNPDLDVSLPAARAQPAEPKVPHQEPSTSHSEDLQPSADLSSRYTISEEHQKSKELFLEKERETARMVAKRRRLMDKMARQEILQQIAEDKENRRGRNQPKPVSQAVATEKSSSSSGSAEGSHDKQCLLQIRGPSGTVKREKFPPDAKLQDVVLYTCNQYQLNSDDFELLQPFPRRVFTTAEMTSTLVELGLSPGGSVVVRKIDTQTSPSPDHKQSEPQQTEPETSKTETVEVESSDGSSSTPPASDHNLPLRNDNNDDDNNDNDDDAGDAGEDPQQYVPPPVFDRDPPPELEEHLAAPLRGLDPQVLGIRGDLRGRDHMWGGGMRLGAVEHNPHATAPVLRAHNPGESALRRLEMRQHRQLEHEAGPSQSSHQVDQPLLHREVPHLRDLCINHVSNRLSGHQYPICSLGVLPHELCDKILSHSMKNKTLTPKAMQAFVSCGLRYVKLDCYLLVTNELLTALRLHRHLNHLSLRACPLITDKALEAVTVLKRLKSLNLSQCPQLTDKSFLYIKELISLITLQMDTTKITDRGVCHFLDNAACCPNLVHLSFSGTSITDHSLQAMSGLKSLKILDIGNTKITCLEVIQQLHQLESLNVSHTEIQDDSLVSLINHPSLMSLSLLSTNVSNDGLCHLKGLQLSQLKLPNRLNITDRGIINIQGLPLVALDLSDYIHVTDSGVHSVAHMTRLTQLSLSNTKLTDEGMKGLSALTELEELNVDRTVITDEGCTVFSSLQNLRILGLSSTRISNKLLINGTLNCCKNLAKLNLSRTRISNKGLPYMVLPVLSQLNLDWTRVTTDCSTLLTGCPVLKALRTRNCTPPSQDSDDSDEEQPQPQQ